MKRAGILARRYARALFLVGQDRKLLDVLQRDMSLFASALTENQDFYYFFDSPEVTRKNKEEKLEEIFGDSVSNVYLQFLLVVLNKGRQNLFLEIAEAFNDELDVFHNRAKALVTSSIELTPEMKKDIQEQLSKQLGKEIILESEVDDTLIGGIQITIDGKVIDGSIKGQLRRMRQYLVEQSAEVLN
jgi:F-type H+-transporting ATPase subunit delta